MNIKIIIMFEEILFKILKAFTNIQILIMVLDIIYLDINILYLNKILRIRYLFLY